MGDNRPNVYYDTTIEKWVYRASALGNCKAALVRERMGETALPPPDTMMIKYNEGSALEASILGHKKVQDAGWRVLGEDTTKGYWLKNHSGGTYVVGFDEKTKQLIIEIPVGQNCIVRCHPDGIGENLHNTGGDFRVVEGKALSPDYLKVVMNELPEWYKWQLSVEMAGTSLLALYLFGEKSDDGKKLSDVTVESINEPPYTLMQIMTRVLEVEKLATMGTVPDCEYKQWPCGFWQTHIAQELWAGDQGTSNVLEGDEGKTLSYWAHDYYFAAQKEKKYGARREAARDKLLELFGTGDGKTLTTDKWVVEKIVSKKKGRIVEKRAKDDGVDLDKYRAYGTTSEYVKVEERNAE